MSFQDALQTSVITGLPVLKFISLSQLNTEPKVMLGASDVSKTILINSGTD